MSKNIFQAVMCVVAIIIIVQVKGSNDVIWAVVFLGVSALAAAFEKSRFLSATEVGLTIITIVCALKGWWIVSTVFAGLIVIENIAFLLYPAREAIIRLDPVKG